jgi:hypothetical protein
MVYPQGMPNDLIEVPPRRFGTFEVPQNMAIRDFCALKSIKFAPGRCFYELTKRELVQGTKEVVLVRRSDRVVFTGKRARALLGLPLNDVDVKIHPRALLDYIPYIQSTSYNRKLLGGTSILFEWPNWEKDPPTAWDLLDEDLFGE